MADPNPNPLHHPPSIPDNSDVDPVGSPTPPEPNLSAVPSHTQPPVPSQPTATGDAPSQSQIVPSSSAAQGGPSTAHHSHAPQQPSQTLTIPPTHHFLGAQQGPSLIQYEVLRETGTASTEMTPGMLNAELDAIPPPTLAKLKRKLGMAGHDLATMTFEEKTRLVQLARARGGTTRPENAPGPGTGMPFGQLQPPMHLPPPQAGLVTAPPVVQPRSGTMLPLQTDQYGRAMQSLENPFNVPQYTMQPQSLLGRTPGLVPPPGTPGYGFWDPADARFGFSTTTPAPRTSNAWGSSMAGPSSSVIPAPTPNLSTPRRPGPNPNPLGRTNYMGWDITELQLLSEAWAAGARTRRPDNPNGS
ncbi:hypothetical protein GSI_07569 [Ganoderma sinense ZZ0214-1]|uniref:Uncharacterized protein n=1 Tax=Ganoderma sinense ZZ0214-1 TaxID=1077348 RepID=A0A2G8S9E0_9APHY|nr:hypothetical protein GSI_07569 [Ganoderma sinense ZZ0214-1]